MCSSHKDECVWTTRTDWRRAVSRNEANSLRQRVEELEDLLRQSRGNTTVPDSQANMGQSRPRGMSDTFPPPRAPAFYQPPPEQQQLSRAYPPHLAPSPQSGQQQPRLGSGFRPPTSTSFRSSGASIAGPMSTERDTVQAGPSSLPQPGSGPSRADREHFQPPPSVSPQTPFVTPSTTGVHHQSPTAPPDDIEDLMVSGRRLRIWLESAAAAVAWK